MSSLTGVRYKVLSVASCMIFFLMLRALWLPAAAGASPAPQTLRVGTVEELVEAIGNDRVIQLLPGTYNLSEYYKKIAPNAEAWMEEHPHLHWAGNGQLSIVGVENLSLQPAPFSLSPVCLVTESWGADVLDIRQSRHVRLQGLTMGHEVDPGHCDGAVVSIQDTEDIELQGLDLYGCGTYGLQTRKVKGLRVRDCVIRDCNKGILDDEAGKDLQLYENCRFLHNDSWLIAKGSLLAVSDVPLHFRNCTFEDNVGSLCPMVDGLNITLEDCTLGPRERETLEKYPQLAKVIQNGKVVELTQANKQLAVEDFALCFEKPMGMSRAVTVTLMPRRHKGKDLCGILGFRSYAHEGNEGIIGLATLEDSSGSLKLYLVGTYGAGPDTYVFHGWETTSGWYHLPCGLRVGDSYQKMVMLLGEPQQHQRQGDLDSYCYMVRQSAFELEATMQQGKIIRMRATGEL